jgi:DNA helicase INO80
VQLLLNDDHLSGLHEANTGLSAKQAGKQPLASNPDGEPPRDLWNEEGDDFFGHVAAAPPLAADAVEDDAGTPVPSTARGKKRKTGIAGPSRSRKSTASKAASAARRKPGTTTGDVTPIDA